METLLQYFIEYHYLVIFFGTFIEGEVVLIAGGFLVSEGEINFSALVLIATIAAIIGDNFFFWLGRGQRAGSRHPWADRLRNFVGEHRLFKGEEFVRRHGGKSVFFVRFLYGLRFAGAMTAGYFGMTVTRFFIFNLIGSFTWAVILVCIGYVFGQSIEAMAKGMKAGGKIGLILVVAGLIVIYFVNRRRKRGPGNLLG